MKLLIAAVVIAVLVFQFEPRVIYLDGVTPLPVRYERTDWRARQYQTLNTSAPITMRTTVSGGGGGSGGSILVRTWP